MCGSGLKWDGEGCPPFYPVISSPCIQKRCAAIVTSLSASNELHMIVCIQMFFVQKNFRLPDCIHCRPNAMRSPLLARVSIYRLLYMFVCLVNLLSCFSSLAVCLFSLASIPYTYLYVIPMPPCIYFTEFFILPVPSRPLLLYQPLLPHIPYPAPRSGKVWGAKRGTDPFR